MKSKIFCLGQVFRNCLFTFILVISIDIQFAHGDRKPHIVFFLADDLGWNDVSFHGSKQIPTTNVDSLAMDGIILNHLYAQQVCSPSRGSLMTGRYPIRLGLQSHVIKANEPWGLPANETILPQYLKSLGYSTHAIGKWHLGFYKPDMVPSNRGFDTFFGYYNGLEDYYDHYSNVNNGNITGLDLHENAQSCWGYDGVYGADLFTDRARQIIQEHDPSKPLFIYMSQQAPHSGNFDTFPIQVREKYLEYLAGIQDETRRLFAAMVIAMDHSVGEIIDSLESSGMLDNTIFFFSTDNGGAVIGADGTSGSNWPLRGSKYTLFDGGMRGTSFVWSPFLRHKKRIYNELVHLTDFLPTIMAAAGGSEALEILPELDGVEQWSSFMEDGSSLRKEVILNIDNFNHVEGIRKGRYKLLRGQYYDGKFDGWFDRNGRPINTSSPTVLLESPMERIVYEQNYRRVLRRSKVARILWKKYGKHPRSVLQCGYPDCEKELHIKCGGLPPPPDACDPSKQACVFDVVNDPCEFYNIADKAPEIKADLEEALDKYRPFVVPSGRKPEDDLANPIYHGGAWEPWRRE